LSDWKGPPCTAPALQSHLVQFVTSLVALLNPLADFALFLSLTTGRSRSEQRGIAVQAAIAIAVIMVTTLWLGNPILTGFGISIDAFSVAGGIILFGIGLGMLNSKSGESSKADTHQANIEAGQKKESPAIVPLGIPISAGPGVITALLVSSHSNTAGAPGLLALSVACLALSVMMGVVFWFAPVMGRWLGATAMHISTQVMGLVVTAIASQMVLNGVRAAFPVLAGRA
jgi:multiple antibiotic resistance protein